VPHTGREQRRGGRNRARARPHRGAARDRARTAASAPARKSRGPTFSAVETLGKTVGPLVGVGNIAARVARNGPANSDAKIIGSDP